MDYHSVHHQVYMSGVELNSARNDGFVQFEIKKELHKLKWLIEEILEDAPDFSGEQEFLEEHSKKKMWQTLNEV
jgi:hypothetical protein